MWDVESGVEFRAFKVVNALCGSIQRRGLSEWTALRPAIRVVCLLGNPQPRRVRRVGRIDRPNQLSASQTGSTPVISAKPLPIP